MQVLLEGLTTRRLLLLLRLLGIPEQRLIQFRKILGRSPLTAWPSHAAPGAFLGYGLLPQTLLRPWVREIKPYERATPPSQPSVAKLNGMGTFQLQRRLMVEWVMVSSDQWHASAFLSSSVETGITRWMGNVRRYEIDRHVDPDRALLARGVTRSLPPFDM
ncbi:MAG: hypothetical protein Q9211_002206 [Gyalolechia sp. 1 TL-2023]